MAICTHDSPINLEIFLRRTIVYATPHVSKTLFLDGDTMRHYIFLFRDVVLVLKTTDDRTFWIIHVLTINCLDEPPEQP